TLISVGQLALKVATSFKRGRTRLRFGINSLRAGFIRHFASSTDEVRINSDFPSPHGITVLCGETELRGWASAKSGVAKLEIFLDHERIKTVHYGVERPDVSDHLPTFLGADRSGYKALVKTRQFRKGRRDLRIVATSRTGHTEQLICPVE